MSSSTSFKRRAYLKCLIGIGIAPNKSYLNRKGRNPNKDYDIVSRITKKPNSCKFLYEPERSTFDGDTISIKSPYTVEANEELKKFAESKANFITLGATNIKSSSGDAIMATYALTKVLNDTTLINPTF